jgi:hypothetical protein
MITMFSHNMSQQLPETHPQLPDAAPSRPHLQNPISDSMFHLSPFLILDQHIISPPALQAFNPAEHHVCPQHACPHACPHTSMTRSLGPLLAGDGGLQVQVQDDSGQYVTGNANFEDQHPASVPEQGADSQLTSDLEGNQSQQEVCKLSCTTNTSS